MKTATVLACASVVAAEGLSKVSFRSAVKPDILNADGSVSDIQAWPSTLPNMSE